MPLSFLATFHAALPGKNLFAMQKPTGCFFRREHPQILAYFLMGKLEDDIAALIDARYRSRARFAREIGIPKNTLYTALEKGIMGSSFSTIMPILDALDLDIEEFARGKAVLKSDAGKSVAVPLYGSISGVASNPFWYQQSAKLGTANQQGWYR